jgi:predicted RNA-binding Zn ribbon-like protein
VPNEYPGPLRGQPLPIELHNTLYASGGEPRDGLHDGAGLRAWLEALAGELPGAAGAVDTTRIAEFRALRRAVRDALQARLAGAPIPAAARRCLNAASAASPRSKRLAADGSAAIRHHADDPTTIALAAIAAATIELAGGPRAGDLRVCGAPGCVLMFLKDHPRRAWCSDGCGNRARQARHYARTQRG